MMVAQQRGDNWLAVDEELRVELAPVFDCEITAAEIARKYNTHQPFFNRIPHVPMSSPIPREHGMQVGVRKAVRQGNARPVVRRG
jgi:hypothetical protein